MPDKTYRAVFFDLDGTLLPMDIDAFMSDYFRSLGAFVARFGVATEDFMAGMKAGIMGMVQNDSGQPNATAFWPAFFSCVQTPTSTGASQEELRAAIDDFYENDFGKLGANVKPNPAVARAVNALAEKGYPLVLATMPMFPRRAVGWRLTWTGVDPAVFSRITTYQNSTAVKPKPNYYAENLAAAGLAGEEVLMVGNNTKEDLAACKLGCDGYLVTDFLLDPEGFDISTVKSGTFEEFAAWADALPNCENPATQISDAVVSADARHAVLAACGISDGAAGGNKTLEEAGKSGGANFKINGME